MTADINFLRENTLIMNYINDGLIIPTGSLNELWEDSVKEWLITASTGAIIYSRPRVGKTVAIDFLESKIDEMYDGGIPVIKWNVTDRDSITEKSFYTNLLHAMGAEENGRVTTALQLKARVINILTELACNGCTDTMYSNEGLPALRRIVLFCDEAYNFDDKDFNWLMDLYNNLRHNQVYLTAFLVGSYELKDLKSHMISSKKDQIIGRFMIDEHEFSGIKTKEELAICLGVFDREMKIPGIVGKTIIPSQRFFPEAFANGEGMYCFLTDIFWDVFQDIREKSKIKYEDIPMKYFIKSIMSSMTVYGKGGKKESYFLGPDAIIDTVKTSGYAMSGGSNVTFSNNKKHRKSKK